LNALDTTSFFDPALMSECTKEIIFPVQLESRSASYIDEKLEMDATCLEHELQSTERATSYSNDSSSEYYNNHSTISAEGPRLTMLPIIIQPCMFYEGVVSRKGTAQNRFPRDPASNQSILDAAEFESFEQVESVIDRIIHESSEIPEKISEQTENQFLHEKEINHQMHESIQIQKCPFKHIKEEDIIWRSRYQRCLLDAQLVTDQDIKEWQLVEKAWVQYDFQGYGYEGFAWQHYQYSFNIEDYTPAQTDKVEYELFKTKGFVEAKQLIQKLEKKLLQAESGEEKLTTWRALAFQQYIIGNHDLSIAAFQNGLIFQDNNREPDFSVLSKPQALALAISYYNETCLPELFTLLTRYYFSAVEIQLESTTAHYASPKTLFSAGLQFIKQSKEHSDLYALYNVMALLLSHLQQHRLAMNCLQAAKTHRISCPDNTDIIEPPYIIDNRLASIAKYIL
jgi:hypothetical protein